MSYLIQKLFPTFSPQTRVWIYQADRLLTESESAILQQHAKTFVAQWAAHKVSLSADATVEHGLFLVLAADESTTLASGCSIDSSVHFVKEIGAKLGIDFFNRLNVAYIDNDKVYLKEYKSLVQEVNNQTINQEILVFDNTIQTLQATWLKPINQTWLARMLQNKVAS